MSWRKIMVRDRATRSGISQADERTAHSTPQPIQANPLLPPDAMPETTEKPDLATVREGQRIWWASPLFGEATGIVALGPDRGWVVVRQHSVTGDLALVKLDWVTRIGEETKEGHDETEDFGNSGGEAPGNESDRDEGSEKEKR